MTHTTPSSETNETGPRYARITRVLCILLAGIWLLDGARIVWQGWQATTTPVPTCHTEMHIADGIHAIAAGNDLYPQIEGLPYVYHFYNPMTYLPAGLTSRWMDLDVDGRLVAGRVLPFTSALGLIALLAWYVWKRSHDAIAVGLTAGMILFFHSSTLTDFFRNRPEAPAILLSIAGWVLCQRRPRHWIAFAAICFACAVAFKQTFVAAPLACGLQLLLAREYRSFAKLAGLTASLVFATMAAAYFFLGEGYFDHTIFAMKSNPIDPIAGSVKFYPILVYWHWGLLLPVAVISVWWLYAKKLEQGLIIYLLVCLALTTLAHGKLGADLNYHTELSTLMVLATSLGIAHATRHSSPVALCNVALLTFATCWPLATQGFGSNDISFNRLFPESNSFALPDACEGTAYAARFAAERDTALILDDEIAVRLGQPIMTDWVAATAFFHTGKLDFDPLLETIRRREYTVIVMRRDQVDNWTQALYATAIANDYRLVFRDQRLLELRPA
ncbi:MAG: hypothetical protein MI757_07015 [Pirellulales bacterium]|nr:hypothetical protein [Pirellulales bacterium]